MKKRSDDSRRFVLAIVMLIVPAVIANGLFVFSTTETVIVTVTRTERVTSGSGDSISHKYLVFTGSETFENTDSWWYLKWNSSDVQGMLKDGETYEMTVYGWRVPFLSAYRNVVDVSPTESERRE